MTMRLEQIFNDNQKLLWGLSYRMTGSAADADDVLQETFIRLMQKPPANTEIERVYFVLASRKLAALPSAKQSRTSA